MKTFKDLKFEPKINGLGGYLAAVSFDNGYGVSVIFGGSSYSNPGNPYELAVTNKDGLCYSSPVTDDVVGHCNEEKITELMKQVQELKNDV